MLQEVVNSARTLTDARYGVVAILTVIPRDFGVNWTPVGKEFPTWVDHTGNAFLKISSYTIFGLNPGQRFQVRVRARYDGYSGEWSDMVEAVVASTAQRAPATDTRISKATPTDKPPFRAVGGVSGVSNQPGELTVSWNAPDDSGQPHDLFTSDLSAAEHKRLEEAQEKMQFFAYLNRLTESLRIPDFCSHARDRDKGLTEFYPLPMNSFLAAPIRHQGVGLGSIYLAKEKGAKSSVKRTKRSLRCLPLWRRWQSSTLAATGRNSRPGPT